MGLLVGAALAPIVIISVIKSISVNTKFASAKPADAAAVVFCV